MVVAVPCYRRGALVTAYRPRLRSYIRLDGGSITDALLGRSMEIEGTAAAVAARLDGSRDWYGVKAGLAAEGHDPDDVDSALRGLYLLHYVEGAGDELAARLERVVERRDQVSWSTLEESRFTCQGSGSCCHGYALGPLNDGDVARLDELDLAAAFPQVEPPYVVDENGGRYLRKTDDHCVFLAADNRCGLHARYGAEAKPHFCRVYPLESFGTVMGVRLVDTGACATFVRSARKGLPLVQELSWLEPLLEGPHLHHPIVLVDERGWDYGLFLRFTGFAIDLVGRRVADPIDSLLAIARCLDALSQAVIACPLEPGQPDRMVDDILAIDASVWVRPPRPEAAARGVGAVGELLGELLGTVTGALEDGRARSAAARFRAFCVAAERVIADLAAVDPSAPPPELAPDVDEALRISLRQQLFGSHVLVDGHAGAGLLRIGLIQLFTVALARHDAGSRPLTAADLDRGHALAVRTFQTSALDGLLALFDRAWRLLVEGLWLATRALAAPR